MLGRSTTLPHAVICVHSTTTTSSSSSLYIYHHHQHNVGKAHAQNNPSPASKGERVRHAVVINFDCKLSAHQNRTQYIRRRTIHYTKSIILIKIKKKCWNDLWHTHTIEYCFPHMQFSYIIKLTHNTRRRRCDDERVKEARAPPHAHNHIFIVLIYRW